MSIRGIIDSIEAKVRGIFGGEATTTPEARTKTWLLIGAAALVLVLLLRRR